MKSTQLILLLGLATAAVFVAFRPSPAVPADWEVPGEYESMANPESASAESIKIGKSLYAKHCVSCHGKEGWGDGTKAEQLETDCGDLSSAEFQAQSDGAMFYKSKFGRDEMPNYEKKIPEDEDMWHVVNYMRTLAE